MSTVCIELLHRRVELSNGRRTGETATGVVVTGDSVTWDWSTPFSCSDELVHSLVTSREILWLEKALRSRVRSLILNITYFYTIPESSQPFYPLTNGIPSLVQTPALTPWFFSNHQPGQTLSLVSLFHFLVITFALGPCVATIVLLLRCCLMYKQ